MRSYTVGRIWGIPIRINVSLLLFLPVLVWIIGAGGQIPAYAGLVEAMSGSALDVETLQAGNTPWLIGVAAAVGLFASVLAHELGHSYMAMRYGIGIESITLWIFGGVAALERMPKEWDRELWIALAGPAVSVLLGAGFLAAATAVPASLPVALFVIGWLGVINVVLTVFNLVPAFPMDGGRVLRALLARRRPYAVATRIAARVGVGFAFVFAVVGVLAFDIILVLVALFVYGAAKSESRVTVVADLLEGLTVRELMAVDPPTVSPNTSLEAFGNRMVADRRTAFPVGDGNDVVGYVTLEHLKRARGDRASTTVGDVMSTSTARVAPSTDAFEALVALNTARSQYALVEDGGRVVGVLPLSAFGEMLRLRETFGKDLGSRAEPSPLDEGVV